jgi:hypothetical protein
MGPRDRVVERGRQRVARLRRGTAGDLERQPLDDPPDLHPLARREVALVERPPQPPEQVVAVLAPRQRVGPQMEAEVARAQLGRIEPVQQRGVQALEVEPVHIAGRRRLAQPDAGHQAVAEVEASRERIAGHELLAEESAVQLHPREVVERERDQARRTVLGHDLQAGLEARHGGSGQGLVHDDTMLKPRGRVRNGPLVQFVRRQAWPIRQ